MTLELRAVLAVKAVIRLQRVQQFIDGHALLLWTDKRARPDFVRAFFSKLALQELLRLFFVRFACALAVLLSAQVVGAPVKTECLLADRVCRRPSCPAPFQISL